MNLALFTVSADLVAPADPRSSVSVRLLGVAAGVLDVCTPWPQAGSRDFGKDHKERIINISSYEGET